MSAFDDTLLRQSCYIDGGWHGADDGARLPVADPATQGELAQVPNCGRAETRRAIAAADAAWPGWRARTADERAGFLAAWAAAIAAHQESLAQLMTAEQGKPLAEARGEIGLSARYCRWFAEEARRLDGEIVPSPWPGRQALVTRGPVGVSAAITPWNFPAAMIARKIAPALAAGCPVVVKPAEQTPLTALALAALADQAAFPAGVVNVVTGDAEAIGAELCALETVRKLSFTGSTQVGKHLMAQSAATVKKISLELGGNAPFIVFDDADLDRAVEGLMAGKFRNTGQTCVCPNRVYVQAGVYERFAEKVAERAQQLPVGDGRDPQSRQGPLIDGDALAKVEAHVADARQRGATVRVGGRRHALGGTYFEPTVITDVPWDAQLAREETFGPVAPLIRFDGEDEVVAWANDTRYGLAAYFYTRDLGRAFRVSRALDYGMVGVNEGVVTTEVAPFGGVKESGLGREGSHDGLLEFTETKYTLLGGLDG